MLLNKLKLALGISGDDEDELLNLLIDVATDEALTYTRREDAALLDTAIIQMCVYKYNRRETEGVDSENYSGVSFVYATDYPEPVLTLLKSKRKVVFV